MKQIFISDECIVCGSCVVQSKLLKEGRTGKPEPILRSGIIHKNLIPQFKKVMDSCPVNAISLIEYRGIVSSLNKENYLKKISTTLESEDVKLDNNKAEINKSNKLNEENKLNKPKNKRLKEEDINEIRELFQMKLKRYRDLKANKEMYKFNKEEFSVPVPYSTEEYKYNYSSDSSAERAGLREFDRIMYSQKRAIVQKLLVDYKTKILRGYLEYNKIKGNFYYDINCDIKEDLKTLAVEIKELSNNKIKLGKEFWNFEVIPEFGIKGDKIDRELYIYRVKHLEEIYIVDNIIRELEPLSWFDTYINTDDYEDYRGKDVYCYDLREVTEKFAKQILDETEYVLKYDDTISDVLKYPIDKFINDLGNEITRKLRILEGKINDLIK